MSTCLLGQTGPVDTSKGLVLFNTFARFEFEPGSMGLASMIDGTTGFRHIRPSGDKHLLWEVALAKGSQIERIDNNYKPCTQARIEQVPGGVRAIMEWKGLRWWLEDNVVSVRVTVELPNGSGVATWRISVENRSDYWGLWTVTFPLINGFPTAGEYDIARPTFATGGHLLKKWKGSTNPVNSRLRATRNIEGRYPSGLWPLQLLSFNRGKDAVYFASMDGEARAKDFTVEPSGRTSVAHYVEDMGVTGSDYPDHYPVAFGVYQGGWVEAAHRYRTWALQQKWTRAGKLSQRPDIPDLIKNAALWMQDGWTWNQTEGSPSQMNVPLVEAQRRMGVPMGLHWYGWHQNKFDNQYPHFLPAKEGFRERVRDLVGRGFLVMPYINGTSVDMNIPDFQRFAPAAITDEGGGYRMHLYGEKSGRLLSMCPTQKIWQDTIARLAEDLFAEGVNGLYVDQISAMNHELCFQREHGHPLGGGHYWLDGNRELLTNVRAAAHRAGRSSVVTGEGADETFLDLMDANLLWADPSELDIPLMQMIYSGYAIFFGSRGDYRGSSRAFNRAQGQAFIEGRQPGWMGFDLLRPEFAKKAEYLRQCARYRTISKKFLLYGQLLQPIDPVNPIPNFTEDGFGWRVPKHQATVPGAEARLWKSEDGHLGVFIANYLDEPVSFSYRFDVSQFGLTAVKLRLTGITPDGTKVLGVSAGIVERTEKLDPEQLKFIEIASVQ